MRDVHATHTHARARAVAELPIDGLLARSHELAKRWAVALILARELDHIGELPLEDLARDAPALCTQVLLALQSDAELSRLVDPPGEDARSRSAQAPRVGHIVAASDPAAVVRAVEALRGVLWEALLDELSAPPPRLVADLSDRLAFVCAELLAAAVGVGVGSDATGEQPSVAQPPVGEHPARVVEDSGERPPAHGHGAGERRPDAARAGAGAVIVDERAQGRAASRARDRRPADPARPGETGRAQAPSDAERPLSWDESPPVVPRGALARRRATPWAQAPGEPRTRDAGEIAIRDERREEGPAAWIDSIGAQLARFREDARPFAVLLVELLDIERIRREGSHEQLMRLARHMHDVLTQELGAWSGALTSERPGRCWLVAPETGGDAAAALADRLARAVAAHVRHDGKSLAVAIGSAVCPADGRQAADLAAHADIGLYAARAAAR